MQGRQHSYTAIPLPGFEAGLNAAMGEPVGTEIAKLYAWFASEGREFLGKSGDVWPALELEPLSSAEWILGRDWRGLVPQAA